MTTYKPARNLLSAALIPFLFSVLPSSGWADDTEIPYDEAEIFFELNDTDGDLGIHALIDGDAWKKLSIEDTRGRKILKINVKGRLKRQGLTEIFFESAEPTFDELDPADFFDRFPEGVYEVEGKTLEGDELESEVELTHVMPEPPATSVNGEDEATLCDDEEPGYDAPEVEAPVVITWAEVTMSHSDADGGGAAVQPPVSVEIHNYEVVVEVETEDEFEAVMHVVLPPGTTSLTLPEDFTDLGDTFKYEVLAREQSFNQTATESCFVLEED